MSNASSSTYSPAAAWNTLLQPFYVLSTVIGILIGTTIIALTIRSCVRRRAIRRRFIRAVDGGWAVPIFNVSEDVAANIETKNTNGPKPIMRESVFNLNGGVHVDGGIWEKALPLSMTLLPTLTSQPHDLLLYLLRSPSIFTSNLFSRLRAVQFVRSNPTQHDHRLLPPSASHQSQNRGQQSITHKTSVSSTSSHPKAKEKSSRMTATEPVQVMFVIAMPAAPRSLHSPISPVAAHGPTAPIANQELCIGVVSASLQVPVQYLQGRTDEQAVAIRHGNMRDLMDEEEGNYASTLHSRQVRSEDPGHEFAGSFVSSRHMHVGNYGDEASSYMPHQTASASPSYWEDRGGATEGGGGSTHDTHNSYLAPPSLRYHPSSQSHGHDDISSIGNQQHNHPPRASESSEYPASGAYTLSIVSANAPPPPEASAPPLSSDSPPLSTQPRAMVTVIDHSSGLPGDVVNQESHNTEEPAGLAAHRVSQFTSTTDTTASATDVEGGYDADADAGRRLSLKSRGTARRRAGS